MAELRTAYEGVEEPTSFPDGAAVARYRESLLERSAIQVEFLEPHLRPGQPVLEVACGNGRLLIALARRRELAALGIDLAQSRVEFARRWATDERCDDLRFEVGDVLRYPLEPGTFAAAVCISGAFAYFEPLAPGCAAGLARRLLDSLVPGGLLCLELYPHPEYRVLLEGTDGEVRIWNELPPEDPWRFSLSRLRLDGASNVLSHEKTFVHRTSGELDTGRSERLYLYTPDRLEQLLTEAGFRNVRFHGGWDESVYRGGELMVVTAQKQDETSADMATTARNHEASQRLLERASDLIPAWTQTLSKNPTQWVQGVAPAYVSRAQGAEVWDVDGNRYLDFPMALGPVILGHGHPAVTEAIQRQLRDGILFTLPHPLELEVAERIVERVPGADMVRFGKSGSDATSAAVRLARACTGRDQVIAAGYHGWHDWFIGSTSRHAGVPEAVRKLVSTFRYNELASLDEALERHAGNTAAVILEPAGAGEPESGFLEGVVQRAHSAGALVVFDEVITGFRLAPGGAQQRYGVNADLATFGKALGNGMPISAIAGRREYMERLSDVFFSGTHGGETLSLAAARAVLDALDESAYAHLYANGERLKAGYLKAVAASGLDREVTLVGAPPALFVAIREPGADASRLVAKSVVQQEMLRSGVLYNGSHFQSLAHSEEQVGHAVEAFGAAVSRLAEGWPDGLEPLLEGTALSPAFRGLA